MTTTAPVIGKPRPYKQPDGYYAQDAWSAVDAIVDAAREKIPTDVDTLVGRGMSGALIIPIIARALGLHYMIVRKPGDDSHSSAKVVGRLGHRWAFVDDFIAGGDTLRHTFDAVNTFAKRPTGYRGEPDTFATEWAGAFLYQYEGSWQTPDQVIQENYRDYWRDEYTWDGKSSMEEMPRREASDHEFYEF